MPSEDVWLSGVFEGKSVSLECITGQSERSRADFGHFQASFEDLLLHVILDVSHVQRIRDFLVMRYINVRFTYFLLTSISDDEFEADDSMESCKTQRMSVARIIRTFHPSDDKPEKTADVISAMEQTE